MNSNTHYYEAAETLLSSVEEVVKVTQVVADIGCGIAPMDYFRPDLHFMIEPWHEYSDILSHKYQGDKSVIILRSSALEALRVLGDRSLDSIFLLDVIEHMEKDEGLEVIKECERVARQQIILFTPLGFLSQEMALDEKDGWGLSGAVVQTHKSGWLPEDFSQDWTFYICDTFHKVDHNNKPLEKPHGAFFAIKNMDFKEIAVPATIRSLVRYPKADKELTSLQKKVEMYKEQSAIFQSQLEAQKELFDALQEENEGLRNEYNALQNTRSVRYARYLRRKLRISGRGLNKHLDINYSMKA